MNWSDVFQTVISGVITGLVVGWVAYSLDERRAKRERRLSDFRIAGNWDGIP